MGGCVNDPDEVAAIVAEGPELPIETGTDVRVIYSDSAIVRVILDAKHFEHYTGEDPRVEMSGGVHMRFYDAKATVTSELRAQRAVSFERSGLMEARENVIVVNERNETLNTEHLVWNKEKETITTEEFVKITTEDEVIFGHGLESNQDFTKYRIKNIKGTIDIEDAKRTENP
ncbi:MAG: LPS export ABC transporter periplasmic protein LptC [Flavobacteriales bacterium]|nr:LPS export ABC transporter periplasmic protein LptC [Flavobacteriales bacterium]